MLESITPRMKKMILKALCDKYDKINRKLQQPFLKMHYEDYEIEDMRRELKYIDEVIDEIRKES